MKLGGLSAVVTGREDAGMPVRKDPFAIAWLIGNELRQARVRLGETQAGAAAKIGTSTSRMNYLETGRSVQRPADVLALMEFYGRPRVEAEALAGLLERPTRRVWWAQWEPVISDSHRLYFGLEGLASSSFVYVPSIVPGLLHTPCYASALIPVGYVSPLHHEWITDFRRFRQQRLLDDEGPLELSVVIDEHALRRAVGGEDCLRGQLDHLLALGARPNVTVQVMPDSVAVHDGLSGPLTLLDFVATQSVGFVEYPDGAAYVGGFHQVAGYLHRRRQLRAAALDEEASREMITARRAALERTEQGDDHPRVARLHERRDRRP